MFTLKVKFLKNEFWYGGHINYGFMMPVSKLRVFKVDTTLVNSYNQANTLFISNKGRIIWSDKGFKTTFIFGTISCQSEKAKIEIFSGYDDLKGAFLAASKMLMPPDGNMPDKLMFSNPQYCTWIQLDNNQNQQGILDYAKGIIAKGMPAGELIIDDGWQKTFGEWDFDSKKFTNPKEMIIQLKKLGFKIILWICPFISQKAKDYEYLLNNNLLVRDNEKKVALRSWWNGIDAVLDFSNPLAKKWFFEQTENLTNNFGIDGYKQDAGDAMYYKDNDTTFGNVDANTQSLLWAESALTYKFNELRACFKMGGKGIAQRISDKSHRWDLLGLRALIPNSLMQGVMGYPFTCPDMIGGGQIGDFRNKEESDFDYELFARYAQCSALMPMMQYSLDIWNLKNKDIADICRNATNIHQEYSDYIVELADKASKTGEPIVRYMEYQYPNCGYARVKSQFMLGDKYIVAPVINKGNMSKVVSLPKGSWEFNGKIFTGGCKIKIAAEIDVLPIFKKV